jgi:hypothetical protein
MNYRDRLERSIRSALSENFEIEGIGFFDSMHPSREVAENGESGWQEKPLAYIVLKATDPSIERLPPMRMDLDFIDQTGPVILAIESNAPPIDAANASDARPVEDLAIEQVLDTRNAGEEILLEIRVTGRGVLGNLDDLLTGVETPLPGYVIDEVGIETHPMNMLDAAEDDDTFFFNRDEDLKEYAGVDEDGVYRQSTERSWAIRYVPDVTAATLGDSFTLPTLVASVDGTVESRAFSDMDLIAVEGTTHPVAGGIRTWTWFLILIIAFVGVVALIAILRSNTRREDEGEDEFTRLLPSRSTPLGVVSALERIDREYGERLLPGRRVELKSAIGSIEERFFGPQAESPNGELEQIVRDWAQEAISMS